MESHFDNIISADLTLTLLLTLRSPRDVYSFIHTSKSVYQIFQLRKATVLSAALRNAVLPETMPDFLLVSRAYRTFSLPTRLDCTIFSEESTQIQRYQGLRLQHVWSHLESRTQQEDFSSLEDPQRLSKIWFIVNYFIDDFAKTALARIHQPCHIPISDLERGRLFRAFCRFGAYRRLFGGTNHVHENMIGHRSPLLQREFLARHSRWEPLEVADVYRYLVMKTN